PHIYSFLPFAPRRPPLPGAVGALLLDPTPPFCLGALARADFERTLRTRGGGLVSALPAAAFDALHRRLGVDDIQASVILFTTPDSSQFRLTTIDQPPQLSRYFNDHHNLSGQDTAVRLRIRVPGRPDQQDDYTYANGTLHGPDPVHVSALDDLDAESFAVRDVSGLRALEQIIDTAVTRTQVDGGYVSAIVVNRIGSEIIMTVNVASARTTMIAQFDQAGNMLRMRQA
uniref:hypothetical protein n=1 Tax=Nocardia brasiliensis TaxID=37326 RepID=UPI002457C907